ncbi:methyltransferase domain-containing protein [Candidatus Woesearchaeota archaeon]|jgi:ubiquinone/menaquinone biosynthesis C-methylase UbiE|nr:methyltransferase domain-containing protein [Candidatus Woesearchaeota archaeon]MBT6518422.1 methyltransferase domain-containing protein [Candidatus Woesearchaeota archaeon]MBT7366572.1 methyltransferase domain-containing protein [Candidatus Woesearchaeota archaeon]
MNKEKKIEKDLSEGSKSYHEEADVYEEFSIAEDKPGKVLAFLKEKVKGKKVLDLGCGTGQFTIALAPITSEYVGLDISQDQLDVAAKKLNENGIGNVKLICSSGEKIELDSDYFDVVISTWVVGTIQGDDRKKKTISEIERVLKKNGVAYLVENNVGGEFEFIRNRYPDIKRTKEYNDFLVGEGFEVCENIDTKFEFETNADACRVIGSIWGAESESKVKSSIIEHKIIIFSKKKVIKLIKRIK